MRPYQIDDNGNQFFPEPNLIPVPPIDAHTPPYFITCALGPQFASELVGNQDSSPSDPNPSWYVCLLSLPKSNSVGGFSPFVNVRAKYVHEIGTFSGMGMLDNCLIRSVLNKKSSEVKLVKLGIITGCTLVSLEGDIARVVLPGQSSIISVMAESVFEVNAKAALAKATEDGNDLLKTLPISKVYQAIKDFAGEQKDRLISAYIAMGEYFYTNERFWKLERERAEDAAKG